MGWWNYITGGSDQYVQRTFDNFNEVQKANEVIFGTKPDYVKPQESVNNDRWANTTRTPYGPNETIYINGQKTTTNEIDPGLCYNTNKHVVGYGKNGEVIYETIIPYGDNKERGETRIASEEEKNNSAFSTEDGSTILFNGEQGSVSSTKHQNPQIESPSQSQQQEVEQPQSQSVETAQEETELKSTTIFNEISNDYNKIQENILKGKDGALKEFNPIPGDANEYGGEINYAKKVSLNVAPISKLNIANGMSDPEWSNRLGYILGNDEGILKDLFQSTKGIVFPYTPDIDFQHNVNYERTEILHSNLAISHYKNTPPPYITLIADFTADGEDNAKYMYGVIHFLRSISKCEFGESMLHLDERKDYAGVPPPVLYLNGWGNFMNNIPVVVKSFGIKLGKDKHYVEVNYGKKSVWLPTDISITIQMEIQFNLDKYKLQFDLNKYKENTLGYGIDNIKGKRWFAVESTYNIVGKEIIVDSDGKKTKTQNVVPRNETGIFESYKGTRLNGSGWTW